MGGRGVAMFKKFGKEEVSSSSQVKSSVTRGIRSTLISQYPVIEQAIDDILPKKPPMVQAKCQGHISLFTVNNQVLFAQHRDGPFIPHLKLLHKFPNILP